MRRLLGIALKLIVGVVGLLVLFVFALWLRAFKPADLEPVAVTCREPAPSYDAQLPLSVLSWNVQYMASKEYVFFYDIDQTDTERVADVARAGKTLADRPSLKHIRWSIEEVASLIEREDPDVVLIQEINSEADSRTHFVDQIGDLIERLGTRFPCHADTSYWQAEYILHPSIMGPVDLRLLTLSRYKLSSAVRHQLPRPDINPIERPFYFQRAILETRHPTTDGSEIAMLNTHFEAWGAGTGVMQKQVGRALEIVGALDEAAVPWVLGGDLNLLPPDGNRQRQRILAARTGNYDERTAIAPFYEAYGAIPALLNLQRSDAKDWYTHIPNDPTVSEPDRTIDYVFYSNQWRPLSAEVVHGRSWAISDHLPVVGQFRYVPEGALSCDPEVIGYSLTSCPEQFIKRPTGNPSQ